MLDSNSPDNRIVFILERLDNSGLYDQFTELKVVCNCKLQYYELCKILKPSDEELSEFIKGKNDKYNRRIEARLLCTICYAYKYLEDLNGYKPQYHPFRCYHYYHEGFLQQWKQFKLNQNNGINVQIRCSFYQNVVREECDNLYTCEWKVDGSEVKVSPDDIILVIDLEEYKSSEEINQPNF